MQLTYHLSLIFAFVEPYDYKQWRKGIYIYTIHCCFYWTTATGFNYFCCLLLYKPHGTGPLAEEMKTALSFCFFHSFFAGKMDESNNLFEGLTYDSREMHILQFKRPVSRTWVVSTQGFCTWIYKILLVFFSLKCKWGDSVLDLNF